MWLFINTTQKTLSNDYIQRKQVYPHSEMVCELCAFGSVDDMMMLKTCNQMNINKF